ncbi:MAG: Twin-arginine translocation pathway signal [Hydrogenophilales bacterium 17-64-11]|nr:MAG: Twin-arginine translocation pathway signal [Hydrogenophilales bacterium 17-64-11]
MKPTLSRRQFLRLGMLAAALPLPAFASREAAERRLGFLNLHTGEKLDLPYWIEGDYVPESLAEINRVLRDHRTGAVAAIDIQLLDLLDRVKAALDTAQPFQVISGYRSPASNSLLATNSSGVARRSLHMEGKAIDIRIPGVPLAELRRAGLMLKGGGVGFYPGSNFVHLDVGRVRTWGG